MTFIGLLGYFCNKLGWLSVYFSCRPVPLLTGERLIEVYNNNTYSTTNVHVLCMWVNDVMLTFLSLWFNYI